MKRSWIVALTGAVTIALGTGAALGQVVFQHTITGETLNLDQAPAEGRDTEAVKQFLLTGINPYTEIKSCLPKGEEVYLTACSGCHGHVAEGKLGPGLNDSYWTYPKNSSDKGLFETIFGGAQGMMGPHGGHLSLDESLRLMAWIRHLYKGDVAEAVWLSDAQKKSFTPYAEPKKQGNEAPTPEAKTTAAADACKIAAQ